jgi:hypothetical protein
VSSEEHNSVMQFGVGLLAGFLVLLVYKGGRKLVAALNSFSNLILE